MPYYRVHTGCSGASYQNKTMGTVDLLIYLNRTKVCSFCAHLEPEIVTVGESERKGREEGSRARHFICKLINSQSSHIPEF